MRNICFLKDDISGGGIERVTTIISNNLAKNNPHFNIFMLDLYNPNGNHHYSLDEKVTYSMLSKKKYGKKGIIVLAMRLRRFLKVNNIDILICSQAMLGIYAIVPAKLTKTKLIIWEHANFYQKPSKFIDFIRKIELKICSYYIVLTERDLENFKSNFKIKSPIDYIYNPSINPNNVIKYDSKSKIILSVGHLIPIKGYDKLIDVAKIVFDKHPDWKWHIYGEGNERDNLINKIKISNLQNNVVLCGKTDDIETKYLMSSMYVMTSLMEGMPMVLVEAKSYNLPIISFNIETGPDEIITDNQNGFLVKPYDIETMANQICLLIENENLRLSFSNHSGDNIERFKLESVIRKWVEVIDSI